jgi:hypothetical protein
MLLERRLQSAWNRLRPTKSKPAEAGAPVEGDLQSDLARELLERGESP